MPKMGNFGLFRPFWPFRPKSGLFQDSQPSPRGGFYINPSRRGPVTPFLGFSGPRPGIPRKRGFSGKMPKIPDFRGFRDPVPGGTLDHSSRVQGPGARGWCKTPLAGPAVAGLPSPGPWKGPDPGSRTPGALPGPLLAPPRGLGTPPGPRAGVGFTSTPRGGALSPSRGPRSRAGALPPALASWGARSRAVQAPPTDRRDRARPRGGCLDMVLRLPKWFSMVSVWGIGASSE